MWSAVSARSANSGPPISRPCENSGTPTWLTGRRKSTEKSNGKAEESHACYKYASTLGPRLLFDDTDGTGFVAETPDTPVGSTYRFYIHANQ